MKKYGGAILLLVVLACFVGCSKDSSKKVSEGDVPVITGEVTNQVKLGDKEIVFSKQDYFYNEDTEVEILSSRPCQIYYSTDGTDPDQKQNQYTEAIKLIANNDTKANCIKAKAYYKDGSESETIVHTYFVGKNVQARFNTLIFSVTTDPYNLYDYEYGIFVKGKLRDEYIKENPNTKINPDAPANFNIRGKEGEREVYLEVFEPKGTKVLSQAVGIRTYGGWSRAREQKSIKIYARKEYDEENNKLSYLFFPERTDVNGKVIDTFKQLVLRNCGNDNGFAFIRDELFQTLASQAGFQDYEAVRPAAMFVNGEYRGFFWMHEVYCDEYFEDHYGKYDGSFEILEGSETEKNEAEDKSNSQSIQDYEKMYAYSNKDLIDDKNYEELSKLIDVENYLSYYALQVYIGNEDWPQNNYKCYRYYAADGQQYGKAPFDGKWRYLIHDMDYSFGIYGAGAYIDNIGRYIGPNGEITDTSPLFGQLMQREDCREIFIEKTLDLLNGSFAPGNVSKVLDTMNSSRLKELQNTYGKGLLEDWVSFDQLNGRLNDVKNYAMQRASHILAKYQEYFNLGEIYTLSVQPVENCMIKINSYVTDEAFGGSYYSNYDTTITAEVPKGKKFDYWLVNGEKNRNKELVITTDMIKDGHVEVSLVIN